MKAAGGRAQRSAMITAYVKLFATLRTHRPELGLGEAMAVELPQGATVEGLLTLL